MGNHMDLSGHIKAARGRQTAEEFCAQVGCSWKTLWRWETGRHRPRSRAHITRLIALGVPEEAFDTTTEEAA